MNNVVVVKIGGSSMQHEIQLQSLLLAIAKLIDKKKKFVIVHGGGSQADALNQKLGIPVKKVNGRRITDSRTLTTVKMVYKGLLNTDLVAFFEKLGIPTVGLSGADGAIAKVVKRPLVNNIDYGFVGDIKKINIDLINILLSKGFTPVIACLGIDKKGQIFNINADTLATQLALALKTKQLVFITDVEGISSDAKTHYIKKLSLGKASEMIEKGIISKGMIPKIENIKNAINGGIENVLIVGGLDKKTEWIKAIENNSHGTMIVRN